MKELDNVFKKEPLVVCDPSYSQSAIDITRLTIDIDGQIVKITPEILENDGIFSAYKKHIKNEQLALFFALNNQQRSLYQYLFKILPMIQASCMSALDLENMNNKIQGIISEEHEELMQQLSHPDNLQFHIKIQRLGENKYLYTATLIRPNGNNEIFASISLTIEQKDKNILYSDSKVNLPEKTQVLLGDKYVDLIDQKVNDFQPQEFSLKDATKLSLKSGENTKFYGEDSFSYFDMKFGREAKKIAPQPPLSMDFFQKLIDVVISIFSKLGNSLSGVMGRGCSPTFFKFNKNNKPIYKQQDDLRVSVGVPTTHSNGSNLTK